MSDDKGALSAQNVRHSASVVWAKPRQCYGKRRRQMKIRTCSALIGLAVLLVGVAAATIITDYDRKANFSNYKTYSWESVETANAMWDQRVKDTIDSQLAAKGLKEVESGGDLVVHAVGITRLGQDVHVNASGWGGGFGPWGGWGGGPAFGDANATKSTYAIGTLIIEISDPNSQRMVWWGLSDQTLPTNSDKAVKNLDKDVAKMFKKFPPGSNGK